SNATSPLVATRITLRMNGTTKPRPMPPSPAIQRWRVPRAAGKLGSLTWRSRPSATALYWAREGILRGRGAAPRLPPARARPGVGRVHHGDRDHTERRAQASRPPRPAHG